MLQSRPVGPQGSNCTHPVQCGLFELVIYRGRGRVSALPSQLSLQRYKSTRKSCKLLCFSTRHTPKSPEACPSPSSSRPPPRLGLRPLPIVITVCSVAAPQGLFYNTTLVAPSVLFCVQFLLRLCCHVGASFRPFDYLMGAHATLVDAWSCTPRSIE